MIRRLACLFAVPLILIPLSALAQNSGKEKAAASSAEKWLGLVDKGEYAESWKESASYFRKRMPEQRWVQIAKDFRSPLGKIIARQLADAECRKPPSRALYGEYVLMHYYTSFEKKKAAVETVIIVLDKAGKWKVAAYFFP